MIHRKRYPTRCRKSIQPIQMGWRGQTYDQTVPVQEAEETQTQTDTEKLRHGYRGRQGEREL